MTDLASRLALAVNRLARLLRQQNEGDLTQSMRSALAMIERLGPVTMGELAAAERVAPPAITRLLQRLESEGFVSRTVDPDDRRVSRVVATEFGRSVLLADRQRRTTWLAARLAELSRDDRARLRDALAVLERLTANPVRP